MKQVTVIMGLIVSMGIVSLTIMMICTKSTRETELYRAVSAATKQTVKVSQGEQQALFRNEKEMMEYFIDIFLKSVSSEGDLEIEVMGIDEKDGMIDVIVTQTFTNLIGKKEQIVVRKAAIYG